MDHGRASGALDIISLYGDSIEVARRSELIIEGLQRLISQPDRANLPSQHQIRTLITAVRSDPSVDRALVCQLEWAFLPLLDFEDAEPLAIEVKASESAADFMYLVDVAYPPTSEDGASGSVDGNLRSMAYRVLSRMRYAPGLSTDEISAQELLAWISDIIAIAAGSDRLEVAMHQVGEVLARVKPREGKPYPDPAIQIALEASIGDEMLGGFRTSLFNGRGVVFRGHGGQQEYDLAERYDAIAREIRDGAPRTSAMFRSLAAEYRRDGAREDEREERIEDGIDSW
jgi:hypothetical protein